MRKRGRVLMLAAKRSGRSAARAQNPLDDIYNWREPKANADPSAIKKWPPYYKPEPMAPEHQLKYAMGWCRVRTTQNFRNTPTLYDRYA